MECLRLGKMQCNCRSRIHHVMPRSDLCAAECFELQKCIKAILPLLRQRRSLG